MRKFFYSAFFAAVAISIGCASTSYPVIFDSRGPYENQVENVGLYDLAFQIPTTSVAIIWDDGSDELYTLISQDWTGDQTLKTYNNYDPTGAIIFLDQTYCDPNRQTNCPQTTAWNPDTPDDDIFDYEFDPSCSGARSMCMLIAYSSRIGECGSGIWADKQGAALEFSQLDKVNFRGQSVYHLPIDNSVAAFNVTGQDGASTQMPIYGRFNLYVDEKLRALVPVTPNARYQMRWADNWVNAHGSRANIDLTYGALTANFKIRFRPTTGAIDRL